MPQESANPRQLATIGMWLFLAALTMLFGSSLVGYILIRLNPYTQAAAAHIHIPAIFWFSTAIMLASGLTMGRALQAIRHERQSAFRFNIALTLALAIAFVAVQFPALVHLLRQHAAIQAQGLHVYGLVFVLVLLHALHVVGGIVGLGIITRGAYAGRYDHEEHDGVYRMSLYWHFLDAVWLVMFAVLLLAR